VKEQAISTSKDGPCCLFLTDKMVYYPFQTDSNWANVFVQGKDNENIGMMEG
jgi:hypothetical protein